MGIGPSHESWMVDWLLRRPIFHRFVGGLHTRFRHIRHGKTPEEIMEEMGGTNEKARRAQERVSLLRHFREEVSNQLKDLGGGGGGGGSTSKSGSGAPQSRNTRGSGGIDQLTDSRGPRTKSRASDSEDKR